MYKIINDKKEFDSFVNTLAQQQLFAFDLESNTLKTHSHEALIVGAGFSWEPGSAYYVPLNGTIPYDYVLSALKTPLEDDTIRKIGHNIKFDARLFNRFDINVKNITFDTIVAAYCLYGTRLPLNLDDLTLFHFNHIKVRTKTLIPRKTKDNPNPSMLQSPIESVGRYCCEDVDFTFRLYQVLSKLLKEPGNKHCYDIFYNIDMPLVSTLLAMECAGVAVDEAKLAVLRDDVSTQLQTLQQEINELSGREVCITKPTDLTSLIFDERDLVNTLDIKDVRKTATGKFATDKHTLEKFSKDPVVEKILEYKTLTKLLTTYIMSMPDFISKHTGFIHPFFNQTRTSTGRLSGSDPNLQNQPAKTQLGKRIRELFVSRWKGGKILAADYSQAELRILAHISDEPTFIKAYLADEDIHTAVAAEVVFNKPKTEVSVDERNIVKTVNFGLLYGMRAKKLAATLNLPVNTAQKILNTYMGKMNGLKNFLDKSKETAYNYGYTETLFGRRRYVSDIFSSDQIEQWSAEREAANHIIQGTNADIIKIAMNRIQQWIESSNLKSRLILQIHDEVVLDVHPDEISFMKDEVVKIMQEVVNFKILMKATAAYADNWAKAH